MATSEEKQELVDALSGPRFYRIQLWGYGGESAYININKEAYEFWSNITEEFGDSDLVTYMVSSEDGDVEFDDIEEVPEDANFMYDEDGDARPWYEHHEEFCHQHGVEYGNARITVEEIDGNDYSSNFVAEVVDGEELASIINELEEESDYELELTDMGEYEPFGDGEGDYVVQFYSSEKGTFFEGIIETVGDFDFKKLKVVINEYPNGEDVVDGLIYDGVDIDNQGGDTNGKGYSAHVWTNVQ